MTIDSQDTKATPATRLSFSDIPDPDNFLMHAYHILNGPTSTVTAIVLSPRPVSFAVIPFSNSLSEIAKVIDGDGPPKTLLYPINDRSCVPTVPSEYQAWFQPDAGFEDAGVREDTELYMTLSATRLAVFLRAHGIGFDHYRLYADAMSWSASATITVGLHHPAHKADFTWDFDDVEQSHYAAAIGQAWEKRDSPECVESSWLRKQVRAICQRYIARRGQELGTHASGGLLNNLSELIDLNNAAGVTPDLLVGGPFTEVLKYCQGTSGRVNKIMAMAGSIDGRNNLFRNQFNLFVDISSAEQLLGYVQDKMIPLTLLPTECVKNSPYAFSEADVDTLAEASTASAELIGKYYVKGTQLFPLFDLVAAVLISRPKLLGTRCVTFDLDIDGVYKTIVDEKGWIAMYWNDEEELKRSRGQMVRAVIDRLKRTSTITRP